MNINNSILHDFTPQQINIIACNCKWKKTKYKVRFSSKGSPIQFLNWERNKGF